METMRTKKQISLAVLCVLALGSVASKANAQLLPTDNTGYLTDTRDTIVMSPFGLCWHIGSGPSPASSAQCDPDYIPPVAAAAVVEPAPQPVVAAAADAPAVAPVPVAERITLSADTLFDFDKAVLRPAGLQALDDFVAKLKGVDTEVITAVGYADRIGSDTYNQHLSEQRVEAVRTYLLSKGIQDNRLHTEGKGETQPVTQAGDCAGPKSAKVIACLQPDRRVELEVVGSRVATAE